MLYLLRRWLHKLTICPYEPDPPFKQDPATCSHPQILRTGAGGRCKECLAYVDEVAP